jgi:hypothetical protein
MARLSNEVSRPAREVSMLDVQHCSLLTVHKTYSLGMATPLTLLKSKVIAKKMVRRASIVLWAIGGVTVRCTSVGEEMGTASGV